MSKLSILFTRPLLWVLLWSFFFGAYCAAVFFKEFSPLAALDIPLGLDAAMTFALGVLIAFRANRAYERWWEARTLWGTLCNASRNLAVKIRQLVPLQPHQRSEAAGLIAGFSYAMRDHLRSRPGLRRVPRYEQADASPAHVPVWFSQQLYCQFEDWRAQTQARDCDLWMLDREARILLDVCGGCERIKNTLMPVSFRTFVHHCIVLFLLLFPWGLPDTFGWWSVPLGVTVAYLVIAAEGIAAWIEQPFGEDQDHLDLDGICAEIDRSAMDILA